MPGWIELIERSQAIVNTGDPAEASQLLRDGLKSYRSDVAAVAWLTFNLMLSECQVRGPEAARQFAPDILASAVNWSAKLYTLELALASLSPGASDAEPLYAATIDALQTWSLQDGSATDVNLISCQSLVRHLRRAFPGNPLASLFDLESREDESPARYSWPVNDIQPLSHITCNRLPRALRTTRDTYGSPQRPLGFRHAGRAFILRLGDNTLLYDSEGRLLDAPYGPLPAFVRRRFERAFAGFEPKRRLTGTSLFIADFFSQAANYCHWMLDGLPRILAARGARLKFDRVIGAMAQTQPYQAETLLACLHGKESYFGPAATDGLIEIEDLYFADNASLEHIYHPVYGCDPGLLQALRKDMGVPQALANQRLYVPRRHSRVVANEVELVALLQRHDFTIIDTDILSVHEQVEAFAGARAIIGPHGAALTNILFSPPGASLLELFPAFGGSASFYRLAPALKLDYSCYIDDLSFGPRRDEVETLPNNNASIRVDLEFVAAWLDGLNAR